jgi:hypothetical protein
MDLNRISTITCGLALATSIALNGGVTSAQSVDSLPVAIVAGDCTAPGEVVATLEDATAPSGSMQGSETAIPVWESDSEVDLRLSDLLASPHALLVGDVGSPVACGDIGGVVDDDDDLMIGLAAVDAPGYSGVADFDGDDDDDDDLDVDVYVVLPSA